MLNILTSILVVVDRVQWKILGHKGKRADLLTMLHPKTSPLVKCQEKYLEMLENWSPTTDWGAVFLVSGMSACHTEDVMLLARQQVLQLSGGMLLHFDLRLSLAPYMLPAVCYSDLSSDFHKSAATFFYSIPLNCMNLMCIRMRKMADR